MRLTNKMGMSYEIEDFSNCYEAVDKLGRLEDTEDKFNIDFTKLPYMLENGIWVKEGAIVYKLEPSKIMVSLTQDGAFIHELYFEDLDCVMDTTGKKWPFEDCGKTWALTKEELE